MGQRRKDSQTSIRSRGKDDDDEKLLKSGVTGKDNDVVVVDGSLLKTGKDDGDAVVVMRGEGGSGGGSVVRRRRKDSGRGLGMMFISQQQQQQQQQDLYTHSELVNVDIHREEETPLKRHHHVVTKDNNNIDDTDGKYNIKSCGDKLVLASGDVEESSCGKASSIEKNDLKWSKERVKLPAVHTLSNAGTRFERLLKKARRSMERRRSDSIERKTSLDDKDSHLNIQSERKHRRRLSKSKVETNNKEVMKEAVKEAWEGAPQFLWIDSRMHQQHQHQHQPQQQQDTTTATTKLIKTGRRRQRANEDPAKFPDKREASNEQHEDTYTPPTAHTKTTPAADGHGESSTNTTTTTTTKPTNNNYTTTKTNPQKPMKALFVLPNPLPIHHDPILENSASYQNCPTAATSCIHPHERRIHTGDEFSTPDNNKGGNTLVGSGAFFVRRLSLDSLMQHNIIRAATFNSIANYTSSLKS
ncbi:hypothetical protein Pmani_022193 [Petrolisthes manimaculis]|uniref:Uncharacterized protein n=1 Tax=Petrolisthes manimaculis TaxID=1843537 RepID=A0AAE1U2D5_9EUCA|nr:hypothetical protein Pmani_022193 [Petrolisthes manimaculis]